METSENPMVARQQKFFFGITLIGSFVTAPVITQSENFAGRDTHIIPKNLPIILFFYSPKFPNYS